MTVADLKRMHDAAETFVLLDVRENDELAKASLPWAKHVPMAHVPQRLAELPKDKPIVVMCHGGFRSSRVAQYLRKNGYSEVANLTGGIDAWSQEIDPNVPVY
ncbi:MAG: rhodanese-like domain-containing protein [Candidatus Baltobacteraceae bacterium]